MENDKERFDILIVVPLEEELREIQTVFPFKKDYTTDGSYIAELETGTRDLSALVILQEEMGKSAAVSAITEASQLFDFQTVVCLGIAGALSKDLNLCDVCYSGSILDVYDNSKASDSEGGEMNIALSPQQYRTGRHISNALDYIRRLPDLRIKYDEWQIEREARTRELIPQQVPGREGVLETVGAPKTMKGTIVCGAVSASKKYNEKLYALDRKVLAIETESGGIFERAERLKKNVLTIRGISDYADPSKGKLEGHTAGAIRKVAAINAASFLKLQFKNPNFLQQIKSSVSASNSLQQLQEEGQKLLSVPEMVQAISDRADSKLRELSPEYKLLPKGYLLPVPRVKLSSSPSRGAGGSSEQEPIELIDCLRLHHNIFLSAEKGYPERSLAWLLAEELLSNEINGQQVIPIVVDGVDIKPPYGTLSNLAKLEVQFLEHLPPVQPIFIINDVPLDSRTKMSLISEEMKKYPRAKFIFLDRGNSNLFREGQFEVSLGAVSYDVCEISFSQMSHFVQKNFEMSGAEAEVIALRLRHTFRKFELSAHPSYFAGIPRSTIASLIQANRRAELMELAVAGFMSFVVAGDRANVQLSRTTRTRFLRSLLVEIWVEKRTFDNAQLVGFASEFAKKHDFDIEPIKFIEGFLDNRIIHFEGERVAVSLSFIEHYLLASALSDNKQLALSYFDPDHDGFDFQTFDLYSEIGPHTEVVNRIIGLLEKVRAEHTPEDASPSVFWSGVIDKDVKITFPRIVELQTRINGAVRAIKDNESKVDEKQRYLDMADRIRRGVAEREEATLQAHEEEVGEADRVLVRALNIWTASVSLLGSGAEHLDAEPKRQLASLLVVVGARLTDTWIDRFRKIDFEDLKREMITDEAVASFMDDNPANLTNSEVRRILSDMIESFRFLILSLPVHRTLSWLCEHARSSVLAKSVSQAEVNEPFPSALRAIWLSDIASRPGKEPIDDVIKGLPASPFLRVCVASHFLTRVYWNHSSPEERMVMLDRADEVLRPASVSIGKPQIKRNLEKEARRAREAKDVTPSRS